MFFLFDRSCPLEKRFWVNSTTDFCWVILKRPTKRPFAQTLQNNLILSNNLLCLDLMFLYRTICCFWTYCTVYNKQFAGSKILSIIHTVLITVVYAKWEQSLFTAEHCSFLCPQKRIQFQESHILSGHCKELSFNKKKKNHIHFG